MVRGTQMLPKGPMYPKGTKRVKVSKRCLNVQAYFGVGTDRRTDTSIPAWPRGQVEWDKQLIYHSFVLAEPDNVFVPLVVSSLCGEVDLMCLTLGGKRAGIEKDQTQTTLYFPFLENLLVKFDAFWYCLIVQWHFSLLFRPMFTIKYWKKSKPLNIFTEPAMGQSCRICTMRNEGTQKKICLWKQKISLFFASDPFIYILTV